MSNDSINSLTESCLIYYSLQHRLESISTRTLFMVVLPNLVEGKIDRIKALGKSQRSLYLAFARCCSVQDRSLGYTWNLMAVERGLWNTITSLRVSMRVNTRFKLLAMRSLNQNGKPGQGCYVESHSVCVIPMACVARLGLYKYTIHPL